MKTRRDNTKPTPLRRALACLLSAAMVLAFTPVVAWGEEGEVQTAGGLTVRGEAGSFSYANGIVTITSGGAFTIIGSGTKTTDRIVVTSSELANITLENVNIDVSDVGDACAAFEISDGATVNLTLVGANSLKSKAGRAGLEVNKASSGDSSKTGNLTIISDSTGSLEAVGGSNSAGIGGRAERNGGNITVSGGTVIATGQDGAAGIGDGDKVSSGTSVSGSTFSTGTSGNAVIFASSISDTSGKTSGLWNGVIFEGDEGKVYGNQTLTKDLTIDTGKILTVPNGVALTVPAGVKLTSTGTLTNNGVIFCFGTISDNIAGTVVKATAPSAIEGLKYNGKEQALVSVDENDTALQFRCVKRAEEPVAAQTEDDAWRTSIPSATNAGDYTVYYRLCYSKESDNSNTTTIASAEFSLVVRVDKVTPTLSNGGENCFFAGELVTVTAYPSNVERITVRKNGSEEETRLEVDSNGVAKFQITSTCTITAYYKESDWDSLNEKTASYKVYLVSTQTKAAGYAEGTVNMGSGQAGIALSEDSEQVEFKEISQEKLVSALKATDGSPSLLSSLNFDLSNLGSTVSHAKFTSSTLKNISGVLNESGNNTGGMNLKMSSGSVGLDSKALSSIASQLSGDDVTISVEKTKLTTLSPPQQQAVKNFPAAAIFNVSATSGGNEIHTFGSGTVTLSFPFEPTPGTYLKNYRLAHVSETGILEPCPTIIEGKTISGTTPHLSTYAIVYIEPTEQTLALTEALEALPVAGKLKAAGAKAAVKAAKGLLKQVAALPDDQRAVVGDELVANAESVVERGTALIAKADEKAVSKVKNKAFSVKAGKSKAIYFKTKSSSAGTKVTYKKTSGSKYITVTKSGKLTAKKGMRPGKTYTARVKVTCGKAVEYVKVVVKAKR